MLWPADRTCMSCSSSMRRRHVLLWHTPAAPQARAYRTRGPGLLDHGTWATCAQLVGDPEAEPDYAARHMRRSTSMQWFLIGRPSRKAVHSQVDVEVLGM
jgi:hypothetical protein